MSMLKLCSMTCQSVSEGEETRLNEYEQSRAKASLRSQARQEGKDIALLDKHNVTIEPVHQIG